MCVCVCVATEGKFWNQEKVTRKTLSLQKAEGLREDDRGHEKT